MTRRLPRVLLLAMYPLDRGLWGATARITAIRDALAARTHLETVSGTRSARAWALIRYAASGRLRTLDGIYLENATTLPGPMDFLFLALARLLRVPIVTYVRDAQQLFPEYYVTDTPKRWISRHAFLPATRLLMALSNRTAFPSAGLAAALGRHGDVQLLPPGSRVAEVPEVDPAARGLLFVGGLRVPAHGGDILLDGIQMAREHGYAVELICITRPGEEPAGPSDPWVHLLHAEGDEIERLLPGVLATITPRRRTPYNDLAVPIKVMEYLGYGRPLIVTDTLETRRIVEEAECGVIVTDSAEGIAAGIREVIDAQPGRIRAWGDAARAAAQRNSWDQRAGQILALLGIPDEAAPRLATA